MTTSPMTTLIGHLRRSVLVGDGATLTDGQLLTCYIERKDAAAFAALVKRHGPMVWGVCRRLLHNHHDAEDAFQATFLVLVRKAASVIPRELVANWLYGVAYTTAHRAKVATAKRRVKERQVTEMPEAATSRRDLWCDLQPLLDQELSRLPDKYRIVIVLCDLEGKTRKAAARQLGCPEGTVAGRLARARMMLAKRLARHGLALSGGALAGVLSHNAASACVPTSVMSTMIKAASLFAAGQAAPAGVISVKVAALTEGVLKAMFLQEIKNVIGLFLIIAALGLGGSRLIQMSQAQAPPPDASKPSLAKQDEDNLKETVLALQKRIWEAHAKQDVNALKNLLAQDFAGLDKNGNPFDKGDLLRYVSEWCEFDHSIKDAKVLLLNDSSAIVVFEVHYKVRPTKSKEVRYTESRQGTGAWAKRNGQWWYVYAESHQVSAEKLQSINLHEIHIRAWYEKVSPKKRHYKEKAEWDEKAKSDEAIEGLEQPD